MVRIIVFGVSGVGKTSLCREYATEHPDFVHLTASDLIRRATGTSLRVLGSSSPSEILHNQTVLPLAIERELEKSGVHNVLIDGQCAIDNGREIVVVPADAVAPIHPTALVLVEDEPTEILKRRRSDVKQRPQRTVEEIAGQIELNNAVVKNYSANLGVPSIIVRPSNGVAFEEAIAGLL